MMLYLNESKEIQLFSKVIEKSNLEKDTKKKLLRNIKYKKQESKNSSIVTGKHWMGLREEIIKKSNDISINSFRSPEQNLSTIDYLKDKIDEEFVYERSLNCNKIEDKYDDNFNSSEFWVSKTFLFNSGMSCISNSITILMNSLITKNSKIKVLTMPGYFETIELFKMNQLYMDLTLCKNVEEFYREIKKDEYDIVFIEPVNFSIWMDSINIDKFLLSVISGIKSRRLRFFIFDNTLINNVNFPLKNIQEVLGNIPNTVVYTIQSLIKLNQVGLEVSNGGVMNISCHSSYVDSINFNSLIEKTKRYRDIYGQTPSSNQLMSLNNEFIYNNEITKLYTDLLFKNNEKAAQMLYEQSSELKVSHPITNKLDNNSLRAAPFIIIQIPNNSIDDYFYFVKVINEITSEQSINLKYGTSFGFQNTRYDVIEYDKLSGKSFMRLSLGAFENDIEEICKTLLDASKRVN